MKRTKQRLPKNVRHAQQVMDKLRKSGTVTVVSCSFCEGHAPKPGAGPQKCPFCGRVVDAVVPS